MKRAGLHRDAARLFDDKRDEMLSLVARMFDRYADDMVGLLVGQQKAILAMEVHAHLDEVFAFENPAMEVVSDLVLLAVAGLAVEIFFAIVGAAERRKKRMDRIVTLLRTKGERMATRRRRRLERRLARMEARAA